jgi:poly-gamma-glutamate system protein
VQRFDLSNPDFGDYDRGQRVSWSVKIKTIYILCFLSLFFYALVHITPLGQSRGKHEMIQASQIMSEAMTALRKCQTGKNVRLNEKEDVNETGLIGLEYSSITTSLGNLEAKRTTTNPNFASLLVFLLKEAGVQKGDTIAIGASSSFPALIVASLSAAKAISLRPLLFCSLGASQWGANNPEFDWLDMQSCLRSAGMFDVKPIGLSLGGEEDVGKDMSEEGRSFLIQEAKESQLFFLYEPDLKRNVETRIRLYEEMGGEAKIKAFINIGGSWANIGTNSGVLKLKPGLIRIKHHPVVEERGVLQEMAVRRIPVVHLLHIKGLCDRYGLPWDPMPLPKPGEGEFYRKAQIYDRSFILMAVIYFILVIFVLIFLRQSGGAIHRTKKVG